MNEKNTGGAAFPRPFSTSPGAISQFPKQDGMTLRDYLAAKALMGLLAEPMSEGHESTVQYLTNDWERDDVKPGDAIAAAAYRLADAMIRAREA